MGYAEQKRKEAIDSLASSLQRADLNIASLIQKSGVPAIVESVRTNKERLSPEILTDVLSIVLLFRDRHGSEFLVARGANLRAAVDMAVKGLVDVWYFDAEDRPYGAFDLLPFRKHLRFPKWLLNDVASLQTVAGQVEFWEQIALYDERRGVRKVAMQQIEMVGNREDLLRTQMVRGEVEDATKAYRKGVLDGVRYFRARLRRLFRALKQEGIFGVDAYNGGWSPHDHWVWTVFDELSNLPEEDQRYFEEKWGESYSRICYVDTKWEVEQATANVGGHKLVAYSFSAINCFYGGKDDADSAIIADRIVRLSPLADLDASWNGRTDSAITICG